MNTANSIAYALKWIGLLWIYTRAWSTLTGFSYPKQSHLDLPPATLLMGLEVSWSSGHTALPCCEGVPEPRPASCCPGPRGYCIDLEHMLGQPWLLSFLKESLQAPQTWPMISSYKWLLMDAAPLMALPSCSNAVLLSERALSCLCSALGSYSSMDHPLLD